jgi:hypothetical protein
MASYILAPVAKPSQITIFSVVSPKSKYPPYSLSIFQEVFASIFVNSLEANDIPIFAINRNDEFT